VNLIPIEGEGHGYFFAANEPDFMKMLISELQTDRPHVPAGECLNSAAYDYESGDYCDDRWEAWDLFCDPDDGYASASEKAGICADTEAAYDASDLGLVMSSSKRLGLSKRAAASENNGFESGLAAGAAIGAVGAAAAFFVIKRCTNKAGVSDDFERI